MLEGSEGLEIVPFWGEIVTRHAIERNAIEAFGGTGVGGI